MESPGSLGGAILQITEISRKLLTKNIQGQCPEMFRKGVAKGALSSVG